jgi:hypothetical protein
MVQSLGKILEENLRAGGKDMPTSMECMHDNNDE